MRIAAAAVVALTVGCTETRDRFLPLPLPLSYEGGALRGYGAAAGESAVSCDEESRPEQLGPVLIDSGTPLSAFRGAQELPPVRFDRGRVFLSGSDGAGGPSRLLLCDVPVIRSNQAAELFSLRYGGTSLEAALVLGGDLLQRFSLLLSFAREPDQPLCDSPPCLRIGKSDLASNCRLASRGEAVFPFKASGGELLVKLGDNLIGLPPTRVTVSACAEPAADPFRGEAAAPCLSCDRLAARQRELAMEPERNRCYLGQLDDLYNLICRDAPSRSCPVGSRLPAPLPPPGCPEPLSLEDLIAREGLHDPRYQPSGTNLRLLVSTAFPGLLLSLSAYARLRGEEEAAALLGGPEEQVQMPGFPPEPAHRTSIGRADTPALALLSRELQLSPCEELARGRRQRYGLPRAGQSGCADSSQSCRQSACLVNLNRDSAQGERRCGYGGQNPERACDDLQAPVAAALELDGPMQDVLVVRDTARLLSSVNDELRSASAQVDGILGVSVLARLQAELDYPGGRLAAHCRCGAPGCRAYRRFTYKALDDCAEQDALCLPQTGGAAPGAIAQAACR